MRKLIIDYSQTIYMPMKIYKTIILKMLMVDMETNKDSRPITNELFLRAGKLNVLLDFLLQSCLKVAKL